MENKAKKCKECGQFLTLDHFRKVYLAPDGYASVCKVCASKNRKQRTLEETQQIIGGGNPLLAQFKPYELINELKARGYTGTLKVTKEITL